ncbi:hypothetical protein Hdeb2414_s0006g00201411 [Helianthus debilis subsp. tardiflorus]
MRSFHIFYSLTSQDHHIPLDLLIYFIRLLLDLVNMILRNLISMAHEICKTILLTSTLNLTTPSLSFGHPHNRIHSPPFSSSSSSITNPFKAYKVNLWRWQLEGRSKELVLVFFTIIFPIDSTLAIS